LTVFYQYVRTAALNQRQTQHDSVFTTELFAYYLKCLLAKQNLANHDFRHFIKHFPTTQLFIADVLAIKSVIHNFHSHSITVHSSQQPTLSATDLNTSELVELLQRSAVEHVTTYRQLQARDFGSLPRLSQQTLRRCTRTNMATISGVYSCLHRTFTRCCMLLTRPTL